MAASDAQLGPRSRPPYDPELEAAFEHLPADVFESLTPERIGPLRAARASPAVTEIVSGRAVVHEEHRATIAGRRAGVPVTVFRPSATVDPAGSRLLPGIVTLHGGGMVMGDRFSGIDGALDWVERYGVVLVTVEYRLAPEHPDPAPLEDCAAALEWVRGSAAELGIDPARLFLHGASAGGGLAAGVALHARDRESADPEGIGGRAPLAGLMLSYPMLDDRNDTVSSRQFPDGGLWDARSNATGWTALLGDRRGGAEVSAHSAPARAADLSGLPPVFLEVGSAEVFRDEVVAFASRLWADGGRAELHVWPGTFHGSDRRVPTAAVSLEAGRVRDAWLRRMLAATNP